MEISYACLGLVYIPRDGGRGLTREQSKTKKQRRRCFKRNTSMKSEAKAKKKTKAIMPFQDQHFQDPARTVFFFYSTPSEPTTPNETMKPVDARGIASIHKNLDPSDASLRKAATPACTSPPRRNYIMSCSRPSMLASSLRPLASYVAGSRE